MARCSMVHAPVSDECMTALQEGELSDMLGRLQVATQDAYAAEAADEGESDSDASQSL